MNAAYGPQVGQQIINRLQEKKLALLFTSHCHRHLFCSSSSLQNALMNGRKRNTATLREQASRKKLSDLL
jgi:hypothetical protein